MTQVVIAPSYRKPSWRRRFTDTLEQPVPFREPPVEALLTPEQRAGLRALHVAGEAPFWGAASRHDRNMSRLREGDVVLFTGLNHVQGIGRVGHPFRNAAFAEALWHFAPGECVWPNVYSLRSFHRVLIPYQRIWDLPGFTAGDVFMSLRFLTPPRSAAILDGLLVEAPVTGPGGDRVIDSVQTGTVTTVGALS